MDAGLSQVLATADELYGLLPEAFVAARDERVRSLRRDGARARALAVKELRRPSVAAWLVNALVRHRRTEVEQLLRLGEALREAQQSLDADQLRELNRQRQAVLGAIGRQARALAAELGRPVGEQVADEVEETLRAALSDPAAANAVRSGRLTTALSYAGFGEADLSGAVALPAAGSALTGLPSGSPSASPGPGRTDRPGPGPRDDLAGDGTPDGRGRDGHDQDGRDRAVRDRVARERATRERAARDEATRRAVLREAAQREAALALRAAEEAARQAEGAALVAEQHRDTVERRARSARQRLDHYQDRVADLESQLAAARQAAATAAAGWAPLHAEAEAAGTRADAARGLAERARATVRAARAHLDDVRHRNAAGADPERDDRPAPGTAARIPGRDEPAHGEPDRGEPDHGEPDRGEPEGVTSLTPDVDRRAR